MLVRVGTRGSRLAMAQAERAADVLREAQPGLGVALVPISTAGDLDRRRPFAEIGERGIFVKELEDALAADRIDVAVHSAKDLTAADAPGTSIAAYLARDDPRDALCGADHLAPGMRVGTASARRTALLLALEPGLTIAPLRGNVDTRLRKRRERDLDAVVLAACGLDRLGLADEIGLRLDVDVVLPEAGQGAIALQVREGDQEWIRAVGDAPTRARVEAERECVARIGAGCSAPVAAYHDGEVLTALIAADDGTWVERRSGTDPALLADDLLAVARR